MRKTLSPQLIACLSLSIAFGANAQDAAPSLDEMFPTEEEAATEEAPPAEAPVEEAPPTEAAPPDEPPAPATSAPVAATATTRIDEKNIAQRGGLFGIGLGIAPKVGGGLGSLTLPGAGGTLLFELEIDYALPITATRDLALFTAWSYNGPSATQTIDDGRVPGGSYSYTLTQHQLVGTHGLHYRPPLDIVDWWQLTAAAGLRTQWAWTTIDGEADGQAFGSYTESALDFGGYAAVGSDFFVGPGAILAELQFAIAPANRFILRQTTTTGLHLAVGYRFFL